MRWAAAAWVFGLGLSGCAEEDRCVSHPVDVQPYVGSGIEGTDFECTGEISSELNAPCWWEPSAVRIREPIVATCPAGGARVMIGNPSFSGESLTLRLFPDEPDRAELELANVGVEAGELDSWTPPTFVSGSVAPLEVSTDGRNRGEFRFVFERGELRGVYDTDPPE